MPLSCIVCDSGIYLLDMGRSLSYWLPHWTERWQWSHWCLWNWL